MDFLFSPFPHVHMPGHAGKEVMANLVSYGLLLGLVVTLSWLSVLFWLERDR